MAQIAVDVVLLPSEEMVDRVIEANRQLLTQSAGPIALDKDSCLPHVSLAMGVIDENRVAEIETILQTVAGTCPLQQLSAVGIYTGTDSVSGVVLAYQIERTEALQLLHEEIMRRMVPYFSYDVTADMVLSGSEVSESTLLWIKDYPEESGFEKFFPHITIGYGRTDSLSMGYREARSFPMKFAVSELVLCHLGNHCTCRKILASVRLKG